MLDDQLPKHKIQLKNIVASYNEDGFLKVQKSNFVIHYEDGTQSKPVVMDTITRKNSPNSACFVAYYQKYNVEKGNGEFFVYLRSAIRPAIAMRSWNGKEESFLDGGICWELPAGKVDSIDEDPLDCAQRELEEELGFIVDKAKFCFLGTSFSSVGTFGEKMFYYAVEVNPKEQKDPSLDGSAMEHQGKIISLPIEQLMQNEFQDSKTEIGLNRFYKRL